MEMADAQFQGANLRIVRLFRGKSQEQLAEDVSVSTSAVGQAERGRRPSRSLQEAFGLVLGVSPDFFYQRLDEELTEKNCHFRRQASATERLRKKVLARGTLFSCVLTYLVKNLGLPKINVPQIRTAGTEDIERAAERCRDHWNLGSDTPIKHMGRVLEHAGVMVTLLESEVSAKLDAFSKRGTEDTMSLVALNTSKDSASRIRYDMAHELGHLVMHTGLDIPRQQKEKEADRFAAAFLLPRSVFPREFWMGGRIDWHRMFQLKRRWKVSMQAMVYRAYDLHLIDAVEFRRAYKFMASKGWLRNEPEEPELERPELFRKAMKTLERKGVSITEIARDLRWTPGMFEEVTNYRMGENDPRYTRTDVVSISDRLQKASA